MPLKPMQVQYLVALCCLRANPAAVDVTVGDMVTDIAAEKPRDVDVTVTLREPNGTTTAFKAFEVKRESGPLDIISTEQLCAKLGDMPSVTHRAIVSASGFTAPAKKKAAKHGVTLYEMKTWTKPLAEQFPEFEGAGRPKDFLPVVESALLFWVDTKLYLVAPTGPASFNYSSRDPIYNADDSVQKEYATMADYERALLLRSTEILFSLEPAQTVFRTFPFAPLTKGAIIEKSAAWPHTHTVDVTKDQVFLRLEGRLAQIGTVTISGHLQWQRRNQDVEFHILENSETGEAFAAAAVAEWGTPDGRLLALIFAPGSRTVGLHTIRLEAKHRNMIRQLKIPLARNDASSENIV